MTSSGEQNAIKNDIQRNLKKQNMFNFFIVSIVLADGLAPCFVSSGSVYIEDRHLKGNNISLFWTLNSSSLNQHVGQTWTIKCPDGFIIVTQRALK